MPLRGTAPVLVESRPRNSSWTTFRRASDSPPARKKCISLSKQICTKCGENVWPWFERRVKAIALSVFLKKTYDQDTWLVVLRKRYSKQQDIGLDSGCWRMLTERTGPFVEGDLPLPMQARHKVPRLTRSLTNEYYGSGSASGNCTSAVLHIMLDEITKVFSPSAWIIRYK